MTFHFPDQVDTNLLTIDATDPKSGTAEFKACAVRVDKLTTPEREPRRCVAEPAPRSPETDGHPPPRRRADRAPSARPSSTCSARRRAAGTAARATPAAQGHSLRGGGHEARSRRHLLLPVLLCGAGARRLDQPGRAQLRLPSA